METERIRRETPDWSNDEPQGQANLDFFEPQQLSAAIEDERPEGD